MKKQLISETALLQSVYKLRQYMSEAPVPAPGAAPAAAPVASGVPTAELEKAAPKAPMGTEYWINGSRYEKQPRGGWKQTFQPGDWGWNANQAKSLSKYTGPNDPAKEQAAQVATTAKNSGKPPAPQQGAKASTPPAPKTGGTPAAPKVGYEKDFPEATAKELQTKLNAAGEKLTVDGKMGPATRAAMARHPEITSQSPESQAVSANYSSANNDPTQSTAPAAAAMAAMGQATSTATDAATGQGAQPTAPAPAAAAPAAAPAVNPNNPFGPKTDPKVAAWEKLSPEQQKWMGGADPTDPIILARMRAAVPDKAPVAAPAPAAAAMAAPSAVAESAYSDLERIMSIVQYR